MIEAYLTLMFVGVTIGIILAFIIIMVIGCFSDDSHYQEYKNDQTKK